MIEHRGIRTALAAALALFVVSHTEPALAQKKKRDKKKADAATAQAQPADYSSRNFLVHTDLPPAEAEELLRKLETMLTLISRYWGRPNRQRIEVYAVKDPSVWPNGALDPDGLRSIEAGGGLTMSRTLRIGNTMQAHAVSYAIADRGTPLHEAVHAYCAQTFGTTGPVWYSEGMAEMGQYWKEGDSSVQCDDFVIEYLHNTEVKSLNDIVNGVSLSGDSWQNYAWRWALCHLLANNENYRDRFRPLGLGLLTDADVSFEQVYGEMAKEISFEYRLFIEHVGIGFRADLCSWDWKSKSRPLRGNRQTQVKIEAGRGWQASRIRVQQGEQYEFTTTGDWKTATDGAEVDAGGDTSGKGRLVGVLFDDYELGEPLELGATGTFTAPSDGDLFLRCQDDWNSLSDDSGQVSVRFKPSGAAEGAASQRSARP